MPSVVELLISILLLFALAALGALVVRAIRPDPDRLLLAALSFPVGSAVFTWALFLLSWAGSPLTRVSVALAYAASVAGAAAVSRARARRGDPRAPLRAGRPWFSWALGVISVAALVGLGALAAGRGHSQWDSVAGWIVKGYGIALEGDVRAAGTWGMWGLAYPLHIPLLISLFRLFTQDSIPGSMFVFPCFAISLWLSVVWFLRRRGVGEAYALLGGLLLLTSPLVLLHATIAYANLPLTAIVVSAALVSIDGFDRSDRDAILFGSLLFGLGSWTRPEAVGYGLLLLPAIILAHVGWGRRALLAARLQAPFALISLSWLTFGWTSVRGSHLGQAVGGLFPSLRSGQFRLFELYAIPRLLFERAANVEIWGLLLPAAGLLVIVGLPRLWAARADPSAVALAAVSAIACAFPVGLFYVRAFTRFDDFIVLLNRSFDRAFLPAAALLLVTGVALVFAEASDDAPAESAAV